MSNQSLFGKWLVETKKLSLEDYAALPRDHKVVLMDEYDAYDWRMKSQEATQAATTPKDFFVYLQATHNMSRDAFDRLTAREQARLVDTHSYAVSQDANKQKAAAKKPIVLPQEIQRMPESEGKTRATLDYVNKQDLIERGYCHE